MSSEPRSLETLDRCGNAPCLDFVNTVHSRVEDDPHEYLQEYSDLLNWAQGGGLLSPMSKGALEGLARRSPGRASQALGQALQLREALYALFLAVARGKGISPLDVQFLNQWLKRVLAHRQISIAGGQTHWAWQESPPDFERPLWPVVLSAAELLAEGDWSRIKECPPEHGCGWIFLDTSKNASRRWCNMRTCGNLAKARRFYRRHRSAGPH